jgi:hypothetical protein
VIAIDIPQEVSGTVCKSIEHRFSETVEYHIIDDQLINSETFETINTCTICSRKIDSVQSPTIFCADVRVLYINNAWVKRQSVPTK